MPNDKVQLITNGVNVREFKPRDQKQCRAELGLPQDAVLVLYAGRIEHVKGTDVLANAITKISVSQPTPEVRFVFVGDHARSKTSAFEQDIDEKLREARNAGMVMCQGPQPRHEMPKYYAAADITVLPSRNEATSLTALESMACATPVIASAVGGLLQIIDHERDGLLVEPERDDELLQAIINLAKDKARVSQWGESAREKVVQRWSWATVAQQTADVYEKLLTPELKETP